MPRIAANELPARSLPIRGDSSPSWPPSALHQQNGSITRCAAPPSTQRRGFTFIEFCVTIAVLIILLGVMVSLARYVRDQSANQLTSELLHQLDQAVREYAEHNDGQLPPVTPLIGDQESLPSEAQLHFNARQNNADFVRLLKQYFPSDLSGPTAGPGAPSAAAPTTGPSTPADGAEPLDFGQLPTSIYNDVTLRDAWGDPIVFMPHDHPAIGMASRAQPSFFFSAGPDHKYLTRDDNLYSYESGGGESN